MNKNEEKHKSDVKETEKSGEMRDLLPQNRRCGAQNRGCEAKNRGLGHSKKSASPVDALRKTRPNPQHKKWMETEITTLFEQLLQPKLLPCRFISTFIYKQREKNGIKY